MKAISKAPAVKVATEALNGPKSPSIVQMLQWTANPVSFMNNAAQRYGHIFISKIGWNFRPLIFVSDPQALQKIFTNPNFQAPGTGERIFQPLLGEYSISRTLDSARYRRKRQLLMPPFHGDRVGVYWRCTLFSITPMSGTNCLRSSLPLVTPQTQWPLPDCLILTLSAKKPCGFTHLPTWVSHGWWKLRWNWWATSWSLG